ncbi:hypothetical protein FOMPIDRAFT_82447 [Fomitopsis schrenkii]|uniref:Uncharacterized protein n=1 Tax=Fomitopsis schrenkii TaxID=2126942 RepID=S8EXC9_FOMSC|nr:hypothetical protein FOMPIDRAFT_82447 [Fomitopsis schrenkii]
MEAVLNQTDTTTEIVTDLLETRLAAIDLSILVRASSLERREQLSSSIDRLAEDALDLNRALQQLSAKIGAGFDRIMSTNELLLRSMRSSSGRSDNAALDACRFKSASHQSPACLLLPSHPELSEAYVRAMSTYEVVLRDLIHYNMISLIKATVFDEDLVSAMHVVAQEKFESNAPERGLSFLWSILGGQSRSFAHLARNEEILSNIAVYSMRSLRYVQSIHDALETMQHRLEELRSVAAGGLVVESVDPEVVLEMLAKGLERLGRARSGPVRAPILTGQ